MMLSVVHPRVHNVVNGHPYQVTAQDYILVNHLDLRGTWKLEDSARWSPLRETRKALKKTRKAATAELAFSHA